VIVAVIDTGVAKVPDLAQTEIVPGWNFVNNTSNATDDHGHGTHVAGTIAQ
jgi:serine protease